MSLTLEPAQRDALYRLAEQLGQPLATLLQGAWWVLLGRLSGLEQALVGVRHDSRGDYEYFAHAVGVFEKTLPLCVSLPASVAFSQWLSELAAGLEAHRTWQEYWTPDLAPDARPAYGFTLGQASGARSSGGLNWAAPEPMLTQADAFELLLQVQLDDAQRLAAVDLSYASSRYSLASASVVLEQYAELLASILAAPQTALAQLNLLSRSEERRLRAINPPMQALADGRYLPQRIAELAIHTPDAIALADAHQHLSYGQLQARVDRVAQGLRTKVWARVRSSRWRCRARRSW